MTVDRRLVFDKLLVENDRRKTVIESATIVEEDGYVDLTEPSFAIVEKFAADSRKEPVEDDVQEQSSVENVRD